MLIRCMVKRRHCPLMPMAKVYEHHVNGVQIDCEIIEYEKYTGEECPRRQDGKTGGKVCPYEETYRIYSTCRICPDRYGCYGSWLCSVMTARTARNGRAGARQRALPASMPPARG